MKIGIDAGCLVVRKKTQKTGVYRLAVNFLRTVSELDEKNQYYLFSFAPIEKDLLSGLGPNFKNVIARPVFAWRYLGLPVSLVLRKPDVFFGLAQSVPFFCLCSKVVLFHDLAFEKYPEFYSRKERDRLQNISRQAARKADKIIAVSKATRKDLISLYKVKQSKIIVVHEAAGFNFKLQSKGKINSIKRKYYLRDNYFLFVGSLKPSKNLTNIMAAFQILAQKASNLELVLVGTGNLKIKKDQRIRKLNFVSDRDLPALYAGARGLVAPSYYEGFGLPWVEAMACGCPVIASKASSGPEVVGRAGILVDPNDTDQIVGAMEKLIDLQSRHRLAKASLKRALKFSWQKFAQEILNQLGKVADQ